MKGFRSSLALLLALATSSVSSPLLHAAPEDSPGVKIEIMRPETSELSELLDVIANQFRVTMPDSEHDLVCRLVLQKTGQPDETLGSLRVRPPYNAPDKKDFEFKFSCCPIAVGEQWADAPKMRWRLSDGQSSTASVTTNPIRGMTEIMYGGSPRRDNEDGVFIFSAGNGKAGKGKTPDERTAVSLYCQFDLIPKNANN